MTRHYLPLALLATTLLAWWATLELAQPFYFLYDDNATQSLAYYVHTARSAMGGELAHLNLHQYLGQLHLGSGQTGVLYPPVYLAVALASLIGDLRWTIELLVLVHLLLAALGMATWLRSWRLPAAVAALGGLWWASVPFVVIASRGWVFIVYVAALLPWNFFLLDRTLRRPSTVGVLMLGLVKALLFLQGNVQWAVMTVLFDLLYTVAIWLFRPPSRRRGRGAVSGLVTAHVLGVALAAPMLLPMAEVVGMSADRAADLSRDESLSWAMKPLDFFAAQVFVFRPEVAHQATGALFYVGLPTLFAIIFLLLRRRGALHGRAAATALVALMAWVVATPANVVLHGLPLFGSFRWPFKYLLFVALFATPALIVAAVHLARRGGWRRRAVWGALVGMIGIHLALTLVPETSRPFGRFRLDRSPATLATETAAVLDPDQGRVISLWQSVSEPELPRHLTHHFATLTDACHLGGYDPLIAASHKRLALGLEYSNIYRFEIGEPVRAHLDRWGVRWWLVPPRYAPVLENLPDVERRYGDEALEVWENTRAHPLVRWDDPVSRAQDVPVTVTWQTNGLTVETEGRSGRLLVALAPLPWYFWQADGVPMGSVGWVDEQIAIEVPAGTREVTVRYDDVPFELGLAIASAAIVVVLIVLAIRRRLSRA